MKTTQPLRGREIKTNAAWISHSAGASVAITNVHMDVTADHAYTRDAVQIHGNRVCLMPHARLTPREQRAAHMVTKHSLSRHQRWPLLLMEVPPKVPAHQHFLANLSCHPDFNLCGIRTLLPILPMKMGI